MLLSKATFNNYICHKKETTTYHLQWSQKEKLETIVELSSEDRSCYLSRKRLFFYISEHLSDTFVQSDSQ